MVIVTYSQVTTGVFCRTWSPKDSPDTAGSSFISSGAKPVDTPKREPEIEERLLRKQEEAEKEANPAKGDGDATGTTLEEQTGKDMERKRKASYWDAKKADRIPEKKKKFM